MNGADYYCFFFSHSRSDWDRDPYLQRFYKDLDERVARAKALGDRKAGFRDQADVKTGTDWNTTISRAVQASDVLVCIFTPNFFSPEKPFVAREFMAFLKRSPPIRYARMRENGGHRYEVRDARNILPILWSGKTEFETLANLPPSMIRKITHSLAADGIRQRRASEYRQKGLGLIAVQPRSLAYREILEDIALRIVAMSANPPPPIAPPPDIETLADAFREVPAAGVDVEDRMPEPVQETVIPPARGPKTVLALEVSFSAPGANWAPYVGSWSLAALAAEVAQSQRPRFAFSHQSFDPGDPNFLRDVGAALNAATRDQVIPILFVHPDCIARAESRAALTSLARGDWRGGVVIPVDVANGASANLATAFRDEIDQMRKEMRKREMDKDMESTPIRIATTLAEFGTATDSVAADIASRIVALGTVRRTPRQNSGPPELPRVTNAHDAPG